MVYTLALESDWFSKPNRIVAIAEVLQLRPDTMSVKLANRIKPRDLISGLKARNWKITSLLDSKVEAKAEGYSIIILKSEIIFKGFAPSELFGDNTNKNTAAIAANVLALLIG